MTQSAPSTETICDYCGLPVPRSWWKSSGDASSSVSLPRYCCFGCQLAADITQERGETGRVQWTVIRLGLAIFFTMNVMAFTMTLWSRDLYTIADEPAWTMALADVLRYICLLCALPVLFLLGTPLLFNAWNSLRAGRLSTDFLIGIGVTAAYAMSIRSVFGGSGPIYFEVGCMVLVFVTLGRWLEASARIHATRAIDELEKMLPTEACRIGHDSDSHTISESTDWSDDRHTAEHIPLEQIQIGDVLRISPGERFPVDGRLRSGRTSVDQQVLTGESEPVTRQPGDSVWAGTLNMDGLVHVVATERTNAGSFWKLLEMVRAARDTRSVYERKAERWARWFAPAVVIVAIATLIGHCLWDGFEPALLAGLSVLLISCPCALGLATPLAVCTAAGRAVRRQVLFRNGDALERLADVNTVLFDKTGTLTTGLADVDQLLVNQSTSREEVLIYAGQLAACSQHPFSSSVAQYARAELGLSNNDLDETHRIDPQTAKTLPGLGLEAVDTAGRVHIYLGRPERFRQAGWECAPELEAEIATCLRDAYPLAIIGWNNTVQGVFRFREKLRKNASSVLKQLSDCGMELAILTGDHAASGRRLEQQLGQPVHAGLLPEAKVQAVHAIQQAGRCVAMVGDGINDAPALAASDVGIALGCGTDISRENAAVCLLSDDLDRLPWAIQLARQSVSIIRQNLFWAFGYNSVGIALAAAGWLNPAVAAGLMVASSLFVIGNTLRLVGDDEGEKTVETTSLVTGESTRKTATPDSIECDATATTSIGDIHDMDWPTLEVVAVAAVERDRG